jgi:UDP-N-acetylglucosamine 2-epimerase (non-hydrolysing)
MKNIITVSGIRPDFIRMSEIFKKLDSHDEINHTLIHTGQHYDKLLSDIFFEDLNIRRPDYNLNIGSNGKTHYEQQAELGPKIINLIKSKNLNPDLILFLGDSNSVLASIPLKKEGYRIAHIEACMRSYDDRMLEEINRRACDHVSDLLFAYHDNYKIKGIKEGIHESKIHVVGNTIVEPLKNIFDLNYSGKQEHIILDIHRPENFNHKDRLKSIIEFSKECSDKYSKPIVMLEFNRTMIKLKEFDISLKKIETSPLMGYKKFIRLMQDSLFIISDSGTAQEEPALLNKPVVVPRDFTERPESMENNCSMLYNLNNKSKIFEWIESWERCNSDWLGIGNTSDKIVDIINEK